MVNTYGSCLCRCPCLRCYTLGFRSVTLEGIHQLHSYFTEGLSIIKVKFEKGIICKILTELWLLFTYSLAKLWFPINNFWRGATISFKFYSRFKHLKIQVKSEFGSHLQNFWLRYGVFWLRFRLMQFFFFCGINFTFLQNYIIWQLFTMGHDYPKPVDKHNNN